VRVDRREGMLPAPPRQPGRQVRAERLGSIGRTGTTSRCGVFARSRPQARRPRDPVATCTYSDTQRTARFAACDGRKVVLPQYLASNGEWITKSGPLSQVNASKWPLYR